MVIEDRTVVAWAAGSVSELDAQRSGRMGDQSHGALAVQL